MTRDFKEALRHRRTYYHITDSIHSTPSHKRFSTAEKSNC